MKTIFFFTLAVAVSLTAATYRWGDSAHSVGLIRAQGGQAKHPSFLESGSERYTVIATATVLPPYRGDARIALEGTPPIPYEAHLSAPAVDLRSRSAPELKGSILHNLRPKDRIALWVVLYPPCVDPVCGMVREERFVQRSYKGRAYYFCGEGCLAAFAAHPDRYRERDRGRGKYTLALYDTETGSAVLRLPIVFKGKGDADHAGTHHH
ncbi:MAG: YHS domain-containing protein [Nitrospirota bacterium]